MTPETNWVPGVIVLLLALVAGMVVMYLSRRGPALPAAAATRRDELLRQKDALYGLLREHKQIRATMDEAGWTAERDRLELEAARVLRAIDQSEEAAPESTSSTPSFGKRHPQLVGALWGAGTMLFLGAIGLSVQEFSKERPAQGSMTGNAQSDPNEPELSPAQLAMLEQLRMAAEATPDDLAAQNKYGHALLHAGKLMDSFKVAETVIAKSDGDPEARTHQAIVLLAIGDLTTAAKALDKVIGNNPGFAEALAYRGAIAFQTGKPEEAVGFLQRAIDADPDMAPSIGPVLDAAKRGETPATMAGSQGGPPAGAQASAPSAPSGPSPDDVDGTLQLDPSVAAKVQKGATLFLSARPPGVDRGPPTWVERLTVGDFPMAFSIGPANAMMGGTPPAQIVLTARIDSDGNAMTKGPDDIEGKSAPIAPGTKGVVITLGG